MKRLTREEFDKVVEQVFVLGRNNSQASKVAGVSEFTVRAIRKTFTLLRDGDTDGLLDAVTNGPVISKTVVQLASEKIGCEVPENALKIIDQRFASIKQRRKKEYGLELVEEQPTPPAEEQKKETEQPRVNDPVYFIRILEELHEQNELMRQLLDVVIPHYVADLKDSLNANSDVIGKDVRDCLEELKAIRCNTRKRGL